MRQAKYRKILWVLLLTELILLHGLVLLRLYVLRWDYPFLWRPGLIAGIWLGVSSLLGLWQIFSYQNFRREAVRAMVPLEESWIRSACSQAAAEVECEKIPPLYRSSAVTTPLVLGFADPVMLIPDREYSFAELRMVFLHECTHVKQRDLWYKLLFTAGQCLFWFQPAVWLLKNAAYRDVEIACDQRVTEGKGESERGAYAQFLIDSLRRGRDRSQAYSAYFYNSSSIMKARLQVVTREREPGWSAGAAAFLLLTGEAVLCALLSGGQIRRDVQENAYRQEASVNLYLGYEAPEGFTETAVAAMADLEPAGADSYSDWAQQESGAYPDTAYEDMTDTAEGPWQLRITSKARYLDSRDFAWRYLMYFEDQEQGSTYDPETGMGYNGLEVTDETLLAGDAEEYVCRVLFRELADGGEQETSGVLPEGTVIRVKGTDYRYYDWALHVKALSDHVYELVGVADTGAALEALKTAHPEEDYSFVVLADLKSEESEPAELPPVPMEELTARGDEMDGALSGPQEKSYVSSDEIQAYAYGGSLTVPVKVTCSTDQGKHWYTTVVSGDDTAVRRLFLSFPDGQQGFLFATGWRTMWQEGSLLYHTEDGGASWTQVEPETLYGTDGAHSLMTGGAFVTDQVGFVTIRSSQWPELYRTVDGGRNWSLVELPIPDTEEASWYTMAYPPEQRDGKLYLYLGMEEYSELGGTKLRFESEDLGESWSYTGMVYRR